MRSWRWQHSGRSPFTRNMADSDDFDKCCIYYYKSIHSKSKKLLRQQEKMSLIFIIIITCLLFFFFFPFSLGWRNLELLDLKTLDRPVCPESSWSILPKPLCLYLVSRLSAYHANLACILSQRESDSSPTKMDKLLALSFLLAVATGNQ